MYLELSLMLSSSLIMASPADADRSSFNSALVSCNLKKTQGNNKVILGSIITAPQGNGSNPSRDTCALKQDALN